MTKDFLWRLYEHQTAALFRMIPGAEVVEDTKEVGLDSGVERQIDVLVHMPLEAKLPGGFRVSIPVKVIVDCKYHSRPLDLPGLGEIEVLRKDLRANLAVAVSRCGVSAGAESYAKNNHIFPLQITPDLLAQLFGGDEELPCQVCEQFGNEIFWRSYGGLNLAAPREGRCEACGALHVCCPDCFTVIAMEQPGAFSCALPCGSVFEIDYERDTMEHSLSRVYDTLESSVLRSLMSRKSRRLSASRVQAIINSTRWQFWDDNPLIGLTEADLVVWADDGSFLSLTAEGEAVAETVILEAEEPEWFYTSALIWLEGLDENGTKAFGRVSSSDFRLATSREVDAD